MSSTDGKRSANSRVYAEAENVEYQAASSRSTPGRFAKHGKDLVRIQSGPPPLRHDDELDQIAAFRMRSSFWRPPSICSLWTTLSSSWPSIALNSPMRSKPCMAAVLTLRGTYAGSLIWILSFQIQNEKLLLRTGSAPYRSTNTLSGPKISMHEKNCETFAVCYSVSLGRPTSVFRRDCPIHPSSWAGAHLITDDGGLRHDSSCGPSSFVPSRWSLSMGFVVVNLDFKAC